MNIGDVVYLKSGSPAMTVVKKTEDGWLMNWFAGVLYAGTFPEESLVTENPLPAINKATEDMIAKMRNV